MTALDVFGAAFPVPAGTPMPIRIASSRNALPDLFARAGYTRGAEIGVWQGRFSERLCSANPSLSLICVDPWVSYSDWKDPKNDESRMGAAEAEARRRLGRFTTRIVKAFSLDAAKQVPDRSLDFVYIDGNHSRAAVTADLCAWAPKVRPGGVVAGHDYNDGPDAPKHLDVVAAVNAYVAAHAIAPWYVLTADKSPSFLWVTR